MYFITFLFEKGLAFSTVKSYTSGLSFFSKVNNLEDNTKRFVVRKMIDGIKRNKFSKDTRLPITREILGKIMLVLPVVCHSHYEIQLFRSAFSLAFHGMFRVGELAVASNSNSNHTISIENVILNSEYVELTLETSKTDQFGRGTTFRFLKQSNQATCPVLLVSEFLKVRPNCLGSLLCHFDGKPLTKYQFSAVLKRSLNAIGICSKRFKSHSFRIGMASTYAMEGMSDDEIKRLGRWSSSSYQRYIRTPN